MILRGVPGPDRLADRDDVTGHAHRIVRNRPREADILRRLRRSDGEIPDDGRSRHIHDETAALRPFAGVADIVHSADAPGILAVVLDGQNRRNIHGGDPHRHRFAALRRITDFIPLHTEEVIRSRPAEFHLVALHRNRGRRFDVGRNRHVTDIRGHLVTDEVETFALRPEAGPVAHRVYGLHAPVDFIVLGQTADAEAVRAVQPQRLLAGDELVSPVAGELGVVRHLNDILHAAAVVREIPREGEFNPDIGHRLDNGSLTRLGRRAAEARNPASGGTFRRSRVGHLAVEGRNSGERPLRSSRVDQEFAAVDRGAVAGLIVDGDIPRVGAVFQIPQLHPLADREGQAGLVRPRFVSMQFPLLVGEGDDILLDTRIRTRRGVVQSSRPVEYQRIGLARQNIFVFDSDRLRIHKNRRDIVAEPSSRSHIRLVTGNVECAELELPICVLQREILGQIAGPDYHRLLPGVTAGNAILQLIPQQSGRTDIHSLRPVDRDRKRIVAVNPSIERRNILRPEARSLQVGHPLTFLQIIAGGIADIIAGNDFPLIDTVRQKFVTEIREPEFILFLLFIRDQNIRRVPLAAGILQTPADRVTAHSGTVVGRRVPAQNQIHRRGIGQAVGLVLDRTDRFRAENRRSSIIVINAEQLSVRPLRYMAVLVYSLNLPIEIFLVVQAGKQNRLCGNVLLDISRIIPVNTVIQTNGRLHVTDPVHHNAFARSTVFPNELRHRRTTGFAENEICRSRLGADPIIRFIGTDSVEIRPRAHHVAATEILANAPIHGRIRFHTGND